MKVCPVCKSRCFDDMNTCYGCMYRFKTSEETKQEKIEFPFEQPNTQHSNSITQNDAIRDLQPAYSVSRNKVVSKWNKVPQSNVTIPEKSRFVPEYYEIEDNVDRYLMLEEVDDFLSRRLLNDELTIVEQKIWKPQHSIENCDRFSSLNASTEKADARKSADSKAVCKTLTLTLEIPQEAMSMLVC